MRKNRFKTSETAQVQLYADSYDSQSSQLEFPAESKSRLKV